MTRKAWGFLGEENSLEALENFEPSFDGEDRFFAI
jgi:hypothetical protein